MAKRRLVWLLCCVAMGTLYFFENNVATRILLVCFVVLPLSGVLIVPVMARRVTAQLIAPKDTTKHVDFRVACEIKCPIPLVGFGVKLRCRNLLTGGEMEVTSPVRSRGLGYLLRTEHCGLLVLEATVNIQDVFRVFPPKQLLLQPVSVWAMPQLHSLEVVLDESGGDGSHDAASGLMPGTDASDPFSVREYVPGDPVRQIHWKLSQKMDTVMLRELRQPIANQVLLIFDASYPATVGQSFPDAADAMAETFLSLSKALLGMGIQHTVCWHPSKQSAPAYRPVASDEDWAELMSAFFSDGPAQDIPILPDEFTEYYAHVALITTGYPDAEAVRGFGQRITVFSGESSLSRGQVIL